MIVATLAALALVVAVAAYSGAAAAVRYTDAVYAELRQLRERVRRMEAERRGGGGGGDETAH